MLYKTGQPGPVGNQEEQRFVLLPFFYPEDFLQSLSIQGIGAQSIKGLCGKGHHLPLEDQLTGSFDTPWVSLQDLAIHLVLLGNFSPQSTQSPLIQKTKFKRI
jgi:hypothetical protein